MLKVSIAYNKGICMSFNLFPSIFKRAPFKNEGSFYFPSLLSDFEGIQEFEGKENGLSVYEQNNHITVEAAVPGLNANEIEVNLNKGTLWIKGEKKEEETDKDKKFYRKSTRSFAYSVTIPDQIDEHQEPKASCKDGVLKIVFQKAKQTELKKIPVKTEK